MQGAVNPSQPSGMLALTILVLRLTLLKRTLITQNILSTT